MKIAMISMGGGSGGLNRYIQELLAVPVAHEINIFCSEKLDVGHPASNVIVTRTKYARESGIEILRGGPMHPALIEMVENYNPDIVFFSNGWIRKGLEKYPNIMVLHNALYVDNAALLMMMSLKMAPALLGFRHIVRKSMRLADGVIFLGDKSKSEAEKSGAKYKDGRVIYFGMPDYNFSTIRHEFDIKNIKLLYVSTFHRYKCHRELLQAVKILRDKGYNIKLTLVGGVPEKREALVKKMVETMGLGNYVHFSGWCTHDEVMQAMEDADIFVYPTRIEAAGLGVMEPMAKSMPIASSNTACMPDILRDAGLYFNPKKPQEIADAVERLIVDDELRQQCSKKAYEYAKEYSWVRAMNEHMEYFSEFLH